MQNMNERPLCHRAEDLVSYLYGEASDEEAQDFAGHLAACDACRSEFAIFEQVHSSIVEWRTEALGAISFSQSPQANNITSPVPVSLITARGRKLSAVAALREFFRLSPLWLRGATAIASVLFCILAVLAVARFWQRTPVVNNTGEPKFTRAQLDDAVASAVKKAGTKQVDNSDHSDKRVTGVMANSKPPRRERKQNSTSPELASRRTRLTRQEREQLAADLRLIPGSDEDEVPFELPGDTRFPNEPK